eukprot:598559-Amphidinium_carterae.1
MAYVAVNLICRGTPAYAESTCGFPETFCAVCAGAPAQGFACSRRQAAVGVTSDAKASLVLDACRGFCPVSLRFGCCCNPMCVCTGRVSQYLIQKPSTSHTCSAFCWHDVCGECCPRSVNVPCSEDASFEWATEAPTAKSDAGSQGQVGAPPQPHQLGRNFRSPSALIAA